MDKDELYENPAVYGLIGAVIGTGVTYGIHMIRPSGDIAWALIAVAIASFFSATFSAHYQPE
jgi:hypothetical protein